MKYLFILLTFLTKVSFCQDLYHKLDSTTRAQINLLSSKNKKKFDTLLLHRSKISLETRIDTTQYDYLFIEESFCYYDSSLEIKELYFSKNDTIPKFIFFNCRIQDFNLLYNKGNQWYRSTLNLNYTFDPLLKKYPNNKTIQKVEYSKTQIRFTGCIASKNEKRRFINNRKKELKSTYQIQTIITKELKEIKVSLQFPPKNPKFKTIEGGFIW